MPVESLGLGFVRFMGAFLLRAIRTPKAPVGRPDLLPTNLHESSRMGEESNGRTPHVPGPIDRGRCPDAPGRRGSVGLQDGDGMGLRSPLDAG